MGRTAHKLKRNKTITKKLLKNKRKETTKEKQTTTKNYLILKFAIGTC